MEEPSGGLVGRASEAEEIARLVGSLSSRGSGVLVVTGEPGIGKTALLRHAAAVAARRGVTVLGTAGVEPEADLPFAGLHRLLLPLLDRLATLPQAQATALGAALGLSAAAPGAAPDRFLVGAGVLTLLADAAGETGVLALVDDAQWLDRESGQALAFAARRLGAEGVGLLFATRDDGKAGLDPAGLPRLPLAGLSRADAVRLVAAAGDGLPEDVRDRVVEVSGGNPLALLELPATMAKTLAGSAEVPLGERLREAVLARTAGLPDHTRTLLLLVAAEPGADLATLESAAARLGVDLQGLDAAERAGVVAVDARGVRFGSVLARSAVYADAPFLRRRAVHAALADAYGTARPDRWAWHRAVIAERADPVLADELERSADQARARAGHAATASMLERAAELSGDDQNRGRRLVGAAWAAWESGQPERARTLLDLAEVPGLPAAVSGRALMLRGLLESATGRPSAGLPVLVEAARALADSDPDAAAAALTGAMEAAAVAGDFAQAPALADIAVRLFGAAPTTGLLRGVALLSAGNPMAAEEPLRAFVAHAEGFHEPRALGWGAVAATFLGDEVVSLRFWDRAVRAARRTGALTTLPWLLENRALLEANTGAVALAEADADESLRLSRELGVARPPLLAMASMAAITALRGEVVAFREWAERTTAAALEHGFRLPVGLVLAVELQLALSLGQVDDALQLSRRIEAGDGGHHPMVPLITFPNRVEARTRGGEPPPPAALAAYEAWAAIGDRPYVLALATRCRALLAAPDDAERWFADALRRYEGIEQPFEQARTRLLFGEFLRRRRRPGEARQLLRQAADAFDRLGCRTWAERTRSELRASGETVAAPVGDAFAELTPQELQIVRLVSSGMSNRHVAGQLFLSPRTVEYHLAKVYPKLGLGSRAELIRMASLHLSGATA